MPRVHISPKTDKPEKCSAKKKECPYKDSEHFDSVAEGEAYIAEREAKNNYSLASMAKNTSEDVSEIMGVEKSDDDYIPNLESFVQEKLPGFTYVDEIENPENLSDLLVKKGNNHYLVRVREDWYDNSGFEPTSAVSVRRRTKSVTQVEKSKAFTSESKDVKVKSPEHFNVVNEFLDEVRKHNKNDADPRDNVFGRAKTTKTFSVSHLSYDGEVRYKREDGTELIGFPMRPPREKSFTDKPYPVDVESIVELTENDERYNSRKYTAGYVIYDTRSKNGVTFVYGGGSEGGGSTDFLIDEKNQSIGTDSFGKVYEANLRESVSRAKSPEEKNTFERLLVWHRDSDKNYDAVHYGKQQIVVFKGSDDTVKKEYYV